jgi:MFS family permease
MTPASALRRARTATIGLFFVAGLALAVWVVNIPAIEHRTGITHPVLGSLLLLMGLGSFLGMSAAGPLVDRIGSRRASALGALLLVAGTCALTLVTDPFQLGAALFVLGLGHGSIDVPMNDQAVLVQRAYGRPIMSSFHAFFSVGGGAGALLGAAIQSLALDPAWALGAGAAATATVAALAYPALLAGPTGGAHTHPGNAAPAPVPAGRARKIAVLAALAFLMLLSEGVANDWSALHAVEHLGQPQAAASLAYGAFAVAMTIGRFSADTLVHRLGPVAVVRFGSVLAAAGMLLIVLSTAYPLTLTGWAVFGIGVSGIIPQIFTAAGNLGGPNQGAVISRVVGMGYLGLLAGPAVIGWASQGITLTNALLLPAACCLAGVLLADHVRVPDPAPAHPAPHPAPEQAS